MTQNLPPYPTNNDWKDWANQLIEFLLSRSRIETEQLPQPLQLPHRIADERSLDEGLLMYDPFIQRVLVSVGGEWLPLSYDLATQFLENYNVVDLDNPWVALTPTGTPPVLTPDKYMATITGLLEGKGENATHQARYKIAGAVVYTSPEAPIANGSRSQLFDSAIFDASAGDLTVEVRGNNATISEIQLRLQRVGLEITP